MDRIRKKFKKILLHDLGEYRVFGVQNIEHPRWQQLQTDGHAPKAFGRRDAKEWMDKRQIAFEPQQNQESFTFIFKSSQCSSYLYFTIENLTDEEWLFVRHQWDYKYDWFRTAKYEILDEIDDRENKESRELKAYGDVFNATGK